MSNTYQSEYFTPSGAANPSASTGFYQYLESKQLPAIYVPPGQTSSTAAQPAQAGQFQQQSQSLPPASSISGSGSSSTASSTSNTFPTTDYSYYYNNSGSGNGAPAANPTNTAASNRLPLGYYPSSTSASGVAANSAYNTASSNTPPQMYPQASNYHTSLAYHQYHPNYVTTTGAAQALPPPGVSGFHNSHQQLQKQSNNSDSSSQSPSQKAAYPVSPQSIGLDASHNDENFQVPFHPTGAFIDYSSLVSYTISPSLKRKRRKTKSLSDASGSAMDAKVSKGTAFACQVCHKVFQKQYNLKSHMKIHYSDKPFQCSKCPKRFARSHDKKRHELLHDGVKNFKCEGYLKDGVTKWGCGKKFARSDALSRHFRTETGWLCIRPLMEESKRLESKGALDHLGQGLQFPGLHHQHLPHQHQANESIHPGQSLESDSKEGAQNSDGSYIYNSSLIRRLIQSK